MWSFYLPLDLNKIMRRKMRAGPLYAIEASPSIPLRYFARQQSVAWEYKDAEGFTRFASLIGAGPTPRGTAGNRKQPSDEDEEL